MSAYSETNTPNPTTSSGSVTTKNVVVIQ